jgi:trehalose/maltose hydrolase-like predicted phosphorylase
VLAAHEAAWEARWTAGEVRLEGDDDLQRALRFAVYHLTSAANPGDERVSIGARGLTGDAYFGHVFWDTETYLLPFYTTVWPEAARALLLYRFRTLPGARAKAAQIGCRCALYAWESADTGEETTPERVVAPDGVLVDILTGRMEHHVSADVAYAVWQYWRATGKGRGRPCSSTATKVNPASVTLTRSPLPWRSTQTSTSSASEVRPTCVSWV